MLLQPLMSAGYPLALLLLLRLGSALPSDRVRRGHQLPNIPACKASGDASCWTDGFDVFTDWEDHHPLTGETREYTFVIEETDDYVGPDGYVKSKAMLINGQFPGPIIRADWGDRINVTVVSNLKNNGTSIHWHGMRLLNNNVNDGVPGVTECPIAPGTNKTYSFVASQYGTSWYHSHYSSQYGNGIVGTIQIDGPASYAYDEDLGVFPISDWFYGSVDQLLTRVDDSLNPFQTDEPGSPPPSDNILFNGTNVSDKGGAYASVAVKRGRRYRLRLINASVDNTFTVSVVGHNMTVVQVDFVPVFPHPTEAVYMTVGQRHDVVIEADAEIGNYWINVTFSAARACGHSVNPYPAAILRYDGADGDALPEDQGSPPPDSYCADDDGFVPVVERHVPSTLLAVGDGNNLTASMFINDTSNQVFWRVNGSAIDISWEKPTLEYVVQRNQSYLESQNIITIPSTAEWSYWLIQNLSPIPHPMHLHGHDFVVLGRSPPLKDPINSGAAPTFFNIARDQAGLSWVAPLRRDTTVLPALGWLVIAFQPGNPGSWIFHCHIAWHISQGFSVQFLERTDEVRSDMDLTGMAENCDAWKKYSPTNEYFKLDSGI